MKDDASSWKQEEKKMPGRIKFVKMKIMSILKIIIWSIEDRGYNMRSCKIKGFNKKEADEKNEPWI